MKKCIRFFLWCVLLFSGAKPAFSQADSLKRTLYEIGVGIPIIVFNKSCFQVVPAQNVSFKIVRNKNVFRSGLSGNLAYTKLNENKNYGFLANAGYERRFFNKRSQLLAGIDIGYGYHYRNYTGSLSGEETRKTIGIGPVIGYIFKPTERLSLQTEIAGIYGREKSTSVLRNYNWGATTFIHRFLSFHAYYRF